MTEERVSISLRLRPATVEQVDRMRAGWEWSRSQAIRWLLDVGLKAEPLAGNGHAKTVAAPAPAGYALSEEEWRVWLWLNDFAEKCYLGDGPIRVGMELHGARFTLTLREDPDLAAP